MKDKLLEQEGRSLWPSIRAVGIGVILLVVIIAASPSPGKVSKGALNDPIALEELERWVDLFAFFGWTMTPEEVAGLTVDLADNWKAGKQTLTAPFKPLFRITGTQQGWGLFTYPDTHPYRLEIAARPRTGRYEILYLSQDSERQYMAKELHFRRVRGMYNPGRRAPRSYRGFSRWMAKRIFEDFPDYERVRIRFHRTHTTLPGDEVDESIKYRFARTHRREDL